ncbi:MAG: glycine cleavage system protein GcvH [Saccharospirillaceae bacterium]|nr:glycine cleavage system protein GcvH [Pseudomonadales bacterium]NRB80261.1 glycine cleavage system protein GcvH [Saccharospirillaceae bacterium]
MSNIPGDLKYAATHEWVRQEGGDIVTVGISDFAQEQLGDVVFVELPEVGTNVEAGDPIAVVESVKAASDIYSPVTGEVIEVNPVLEDAPETVNEDSYDYGWFFKIRQTQGGDLEELMDAESYQDQCEE